MSRRFIVRPLAEADLEHAARWYDEEQTGLGSRFLNAVDQVFGRIHERPQQFPVVSGDFERESATSARLWQKRQVELAAERDRRPE